ncbi:MAG: YraN family protein [Treponema sp.]|nr:YraN family protein [Treponema sp.]
MPNSKSSAALGKAGEEQAAVFLQAAGMEIIVKNYRSKIAGRQTGEIDIIALDKETIVFTEVKNWSSLGFENLQYGLDVRKQRKIIKTAKYFLSENRKYNKMSIRFDVIFINNKGSEGTLRSAGTQITHLASAFTERV